MRFFLASFCLIFLSIDSFSQETTTENVEVYNSFIDYKKDSSFSNVCTIRKGENKDTKFLKVNCGPTPLTHIWGVDFHNNIWIKNNLKKKFYKMEEDSVGLYYDMFNNDGFSLGSAGLMVAGAAFGMMIIPIENPNGLLTNVTVRYRQDTISKYFYPFGFPKLPNSKVFYYFTKYGKNETLVNLKVDGKIISLTKGSYYEETYPSTLPHYVKGLCLEETPAPFKVKILPAETTVILINRDRKGVVKFETMNSDMVFDFLKRKEKYQRIN